MSDGKRLEREIISLAVKGQEIIEKLVCWSTWRQEWTTLSFVNV